MATLEGNMLMLLPHETVYDDINTMVRIVMDANQLPSDLTLTWSLQVRIKQPKTMLYFEIEAPYLNTWVDWRKFLHDGETISFCESDLHSIGRHESNLIFIVHPSRMEWDIPQEAVCPALELALMEARRMQLTFADSDSELESEADVMAEAELEPEPEPELEPEPESASESETETEDSDIEES